MKYKTKQEAINDLLVELQHLFSSLHNEYLAQSAREEIPEVQKEIQRINNLTEEQHKKEFDEKIGKIERAKQQGYISISERKPETGRKISILFFSEISEINPEGKRDGIVESGKEGLYLIYKDKFTTEYEKIIKERKEHGAIGTGAYNTDRFIYPGYGGSIALYRVKEEVYWKYIDAQN